ncbi:hypothetical protein E6C27_scaffold44G003950 [Cucumis melo var. makuwa]|uniref:Uncharacterized protein n=1 Tax=Cucumis melo var. makuwa TaxID=1194695 RepID=A0A5A7THV8_CUCMM|nr:hypothetical protein E6C27_scaffold44G003950 [Cucumis melo var. makuwa]
MASTLQGKVKKHKDESHSSKSYHRHWKKPLKKVKVSGDAPSERGSSAMRVTDVPSLVCTFSFHKLFFVHLLFDSPIEEVGTSKTPVAKLVEQSLNRPKAPLEKVRSIQAPLKILELPLDISKRQAARHPKPSQWIGENVVSNFFQKTALYKVRQLNKKTSPIKEALTLMDQLQGDARVIQDRVAQLSLKMKELKSRLQSINAKFEQLLILSCEKTEAIDKQELEVVKL